MNYSIIYGGVDYPVKATEESIGGIANGIANVLRDGDDYWYEIETKTGTVNLLVTPGTPIAIVGKKPGRGMV